MTAIPLPRRDAGQVTVRRLLCLLPLALVLVVAVRHRAVPVEGLAQSASARRPWLAAAVGALLPAGASTPLLATAVAVACAAVVVVLLVRRLRGAVFGFVRTVLGEARAVHTRPARVLALWGGSLAFLALQAGVPVSVGLALGLRVPVAHMALAYLAATVAVAVVPTPGGLGTVEAALVVALAAARSPW